MAKKHTDAPVGSPQFDGLIYTVRGARVMLDRDLAEIYGVATRVFNQAVKRNKSRFPEDFMFQLTRAEAESIRRSRSQTVTLKRGQNTKYLPSAFTEYGALMAANILNSARAVQNEYDVRGRRWIDGIARLGSGRAIGRTRVNIFVVRAFAKMRESLRAAPDLARKLADLEKKLTGRLDVHEAAIVGVLQELLKILNPPPGPPPPPTPPKTSHWF